MRNVDGERPPTAWPPLVIADGTLEALKWLGLILMVGDHINSRLFNGTVLGLFELGRLALPLFVFVLVYNLARPCALHRGAYGRTITRLAFFGTVASLPYMAVGGLRYGWYPLNVLFTLLVIAGTARLLETDQTAHRVAAGSFFFIGGSLVEFWWPAVLLGVATWSYIKRPTAAAAMLALLGCAALGIVNESQWALAGAALVALATRINAPIARCAWIFYWLYPLHLAVLWARRIPMRKAGYLFFT